MGFWKGNFRGVGLAIVLLLAVLVGSPGCGAEQSCREGYHECVSDCHDDYRNCDQFNYFEWCKDNYNSCLDYCADVFCDPLEGE